MASPAVRNRIIGQLGPYQIESLVGRGGAAAVYRARVANSDQTTALKVLSHSSMQQDELQASFEREYRTAADLTHPGIVKVLDSGEIDGRTFIAMAFIAGKTLDKYLEQRETLGEGEAIAIASQVAQTIDYLHQQKIVHRDVKPGNLILTAEGEVKLTDFGVALDLSTPLPHRGVDKPHMIYGTPGYIAPEQIEPDSPIDGRADIYSLGIVLYRMVTGRKPFYGSRTQVLQAHAHELPPAPSSVANVSKGLEAVILKAIAKDRASRYQSGAEFAEALSKVEPLEEERRGFLQRLLHWR